MRSDRGNIQRSTASFATSSALNSDEKIGAALTRLKDGEGITCKLAEEDFTLYSMAEHVLLESEVL